MYIQCAYKNAARDRDVESYAVEKIRSRVEQLVAKPVGIHVKFEADAGLETTNCRIIAGDGQSVQARHSATSFYQSIDGLVDKLAGQLRRKKAKRRTRALRGHDAAGRQEYGLGVPRGLPEPEEIETFASADWDNWFYETPLH